MLTKIPLEEIYEIYVAAPDDKKPRWVEMAYQFGAGDMTDPAARNEVANHIRGYLVKNKRIQVLSPKTRAERLTEAHPFLAEQCTTVGMPITRNKHYWAKTDKGSFFVTVEQDGVEAGKSLEEMLRESIEEAKQYAPVYPTIDRTPSEDGCLFVVDPADPHFGKLAMAEQTGENYNLKIAEERFAHGIEGLIKKVSGYNIDQILFIGGNDFLHTDTTNRTTTSGTPQDTDQQWFNHFQVAKRSLIAGIERLLTVANVHFVHCPSNHDYLSGYYLADTIMSWFANNPNITFDVSPTHRKYIQYGSNLIGATHGNGAREIALPELMKSEAKQAWARSKYAYFFCHHIHHADRSAMKGRKKVMFEKDYSDVTVLGTGHGIDPSDYCHVEYLRSQSGTDAWHSEKGFCHGKTAMEGFVHSKDHGQIAKITHLF